MAAQYRFVDISDDDLCDLGTIPAPLCSSVHLENKGIGVDIPLDFFQL